MKSCRVLRTMILVTKVHAAGRDVTDPEPLPKDHPLWKMDNVIITPNCAEAGPRRYVYMAEIIANNDNLLRAWYLTRRARTWRRTSAGSYMTQGRCSPPPTPTRRWGAAIRPRRL